MREMNDQLERLNRVGEPMKMRFYHNPGQYYVCTAMWGTDISFDALETIKIPDDKTLKRAVIGRTIQQLQEQIDYLKSL